MFDQGVQNFDFDNYINGNNNTIDNNVDINMMYNGNMINGGGVNPVNEGVQERVVERTIVHEVPHVCPIHTRIINTCSEENTVSNVQCGSCCNFR